MASRLSISAAALPSAKAAWFCAIPSATCFPRDRRKSCLNLGDVNYIDSSGIGELVSAFTTAKNQGGELKLLNLTKKVHDLLQITKLYTVFDVKEDEAGAVKSFNK
jgi:anti-sigma B factor antagonist